MIKSFTDAEDIFTEVVAFREKVLKTAAEKTWHDWKKLHSYGVYDIGALLLLEDVELRAIQNSSSLRELAGAALLLHDLARFYQYHRDRVIPMNHGLVAAQMLRVRFNENNPFILLPIKYHDKLDLTTLFMDVDFLALADDEKEIALLLVKLVRDADKLDNYIKHHKMGEITRLGNINHRYTFSEEILAAISQRRAVNVAKINGLSMFDFITFLITWQYDFAFSSSHSMTKKYNMNRFFINELRRHAKIGYEMKDSPEVKVLASQYSELLAQIAVIENVLLSHNLL